jgi:hypothetical protein
VDRHLFDADPDPTFHFDANPDSDPDQDPTQVKHKLKLENQKFSLEQYQFSLFLPFSSVS